MGVNPMKGYTIPQVLMYVTTLSLQMSIIYLGMLLLVYKESVTITDVTYVLDSFMLISHGLTKCTLVFVKRNNIRDLLDRIDNFWKIEDVQDEAERKEHEKYLKFIKTMSFLYNFLCICTTLTFSCKPLSGELSFNTYRPERIPFHLLQVYESIAFIVGIYLPLTGLDIFVLTLLLLTKMQFKLLNQEMERLFNEMASSDGKSKHFDKKIKKLVEYHDFLLDFVDRINKGFSEGLLVYVIVLVVGMSVQMYDVSTEPTLIGLIEPIARLITGLTQFTFCYCLPAQAVTDEADRTTEYAYFNKWYDNPSSAKAAQLMILGRSQRKTHILAGGIVNIDLETCLKTIKTMVSYAMFIRTMGIGQD